MELSTMSSAGLYPDFLFYNATDFGFNGSLNDTRPYPVKNITSIVIAIAITALYSVVCVVGLLGNILVMYGIVRMELSTMSGAGLYADFLFYNAKDFGFNGGLNETFPPPSPREPEGNCPLVALPSSATGTSH